jgi:hypothetical protein
MKNNTHRPTPPLSKYTIADALDRATSHIVRAEYQFTIAGPRQKEHWERALEHLKWTRGALEEAAGVLETMLVTLYGPREGGPG